MTKSETISPGQSTTITAVYDTWKLSGNSKKTLTVFTHESDETIYLPIQLEAKPIHQLEPVLVSWKKSQNRNVKPLPIK